MMLMATAFIWTRKLSCALYTNTALCPVEALIVRRVEINNMKISNEELNKPVIKKKDGEFATLKELLEGKMKRDRGQIFILDNLLLKLKWAKNLN